MCEIREGVRGGKLRGEGASLRSRPRSKAVGAERCTGAHLELGEGVQPCCDKREHTAGGHLGDRYLGQHCFVRVESAFAGGETSPMQTGRREGVS